MTKFTFFFHTENRLANVLYFHFASFDSLKAVTGCFEKLDTSAKRFGLKNDMN